MVLFLVFAASLASIVQAFSPAGLTSTARVNNGIHYITFNNPRGTQTNSQLFTQGPLVEDGDWAAYLDEENTGLVYYFNKKTDESVWEKPYASFPDVVEDLETVVVFTGEGEEDKASSFELPSFSFPKFFATDDVKDDVNGDSIDDVVIDEDSEVQETNGSGILDNFFGRDTKSKVVQKEIEVTENENESETELQEVKPNGIFSNLFSGTSSKKTTGETAIIEEKVVIKPKTTEKEMKNVVLDKTPSMPSEYVKTKIGLEINSKVLPHPEKIKWGGEDAVFTSGRSFGVFDGVSGAEKEQGKALYSKTLANQVKVRVGKDGLSMSDMISVLAEVTDIANKQATGASTALVASIDENNILRVLNVGDCKLIVIRDGVIVKQSKDIIHYFDCPFQLSEDSPDRARDGTKLSFELMKGDIIVSGSDGVFDNISEKRIARIINSKLWSISSQAIVDKICNEARKVSLDDQAETPYAKVAKRYYDEYSQGVGGKVDDISCIMVRCT